MPSRSRVLVFEFLLAIIALSITSANRNQAKSKRYYYGEPLAADEPISIKCQAGNISCEANCVEQNKTTPGEGSAFNETRCASSGYHFYFAFSRMTKLSPGWFMSNALITKVTIRDEGSIVEIEPGAFDNGTFRYVWSLEIRGTAMTSLKMGALAGLNNLKTLSLYANNNMNGIEENAMENLLQLEEFIMEEQRQFKDLRNVTETVEWNYLRSLVLTKNSFGSTIKRPTFEGCTQVRQLNLSNSEIEAIGQHSFRPMEQTIEVLDLRYNRLKVLSSGLLENLMRPNVRFYLSNNLWDCTCDSLELQGYDINNSNLIVDSPLVCEMPVSENGRCMRDVSIECYYSTPYYSDVTTVPTSTPAYLDRLSCSDETESYSHSSGVAVEMEYQFFTIKQEGRDTVSISINYPDSSLALVYINDHDYKVRCQYNLERKMKFGSLYTNAGYLFCLIKKLSNTTSPRNCLPFHFTEPRFFWGRDRIILTLVCSFAMATILGIIVGWTVICRYRRSVVKSATVLRTGPRDSRSKIHIDYLNSWSTYQQKRFLMKSNNGGANLRRSCSENSLSSHKTYLAPSPVIELMNPRNRNNIQNSDEYSMRRYMDTLPYDVLPPPLPPCNSRK